MIENRVECYLCGSMTALGMHAHRNTEGKIVGWIFICKIHQEHEIPETLSSSPQDPLPWDVLIDGIKRLASYEAFTLPRAINKEYDEELLARMNFAKELLSRFPERGGK